MKAAEFRKQWSHQPTPIKQNASGLWYSEECTDELMAEFAALAVREATAGTPPQVEPVKLRPFEDGYDFPAKKDKAQVERHAADLKRVLRRKLRHYGAQEKRALCAIFGQRQKEGRDILRPELRAPADTEPPKEGL